MARPLLLPLLLLLLGAGRGAILPDSMLAGRSVLLLGCHADETARCELAGAADVVAVLTDFAAPSSRDVQERTATGQWLLANAAVPGFTEALAPLVMAGGSRDLALVCGGGVAQTFKLAALGLASARSLVLEALLPPACAASEAALHAALGLQAPELLGHLRETGRAVYRAAGRPARPGRAFREAVLPRLPSLSPSDECELPEDPLLRPPAPPRPHYGDGFSLLVAPPPAQRGRSSVAFSLQYGANVADARNVCLVPGRGLVLFRGDGPGPEPEPVLPARLRERLLRQGQYGFRYNWGWAEAEGAAPAGGGGAGAGAGVVWHAGNSVVTVPAYPRHLTHFAEVLVPLLHAALHPGVFATAVTADQLVLYQVSRQSELPYNLAFAEFALGFVGRAAGGRRPPRVLLQEDLGAQVHCFHHAALVGMGTSEFGLFADAWEAQHVREALWAHAGVPLPLPLPLPSEANAPVRVLVAPRTHNRRLVNHGAVVQALERSGLATVQTRALEQGSLAEQVRWMAETDVLVGAHGAALHNALYMAPGSVVIDILPARYVEFEWHNSAAGAGVHYLFLHPPADGSASLNCDNPCPTAWPYDASAMECLAARNCDVRVDLGQLDALFRQAAFLVRKRALVRGQNGRGGGGDRVREWRRGRMPDGRMESLEVGV